MHSPVLCHAARRAARHTQVVSWAGTSPDGRAVTGTLATMKRLFNPNNTDVD